jgi:hypothetical protein
MRRTFLAVLAVVALALATGCGDEQVKADNAYVAATDRAVRSFETQFQDLQSSFTSVSTPRQDLQTMGRLRVAVDRVVAQLRRVQAPARIAPLHAQLIDQVQAYDGAIAAAEPEFGSEVPKAVAAARTRFSSLLAATAAKVTATINLINGRLR